jgi:hypothetical protein
MDGNNSLITQCFIKLTNVKTRIVERVHAQIITLRNKEESSIHPLQINVLSLSPKTE